VCVLFVAWKVRDDVPLIVAANRDEAYDRPADTLHAWDDCAGVVAGRDRVAGGTWMGASQQRRWASVTNIRHPRWMQPIAGPSRGRLVADFLCGLESPQGYAEWVAEEREAYAGFNLLLGDEQTLYFVAREESEARHLEPGFYGLSNAGLDDPWPKVARGGAAFREWVEGDLALEDGLLLLNDREQAPDDLLPDTGVGTELERLLSPLFIVGDAYGTRSSTVLTFNADGGGVMIERTFGPGGVPQGTTQQRFAKSSGRSDR